MPTAEALKALRSPDRTQNKYGVAAKENRTWNGVQYASAAEMRDAQDFALLLRVGAVSKVERQFPICFNLNGKTIFRHYVDFRIEYPDGSFKYVERKGWATAEYKLKMRLLHAQDPGLKDCYEVRKK